MFRKPRKIEKHFNKENLQKGTDDHGKELNKAKSFEFLNDLQDLINLSKRLIKLSPVGINIIPVQDV